MDFIPSASPTSNDRAFAVLRSSAEPLHDFAVVFLECSSLCYVR